MGVAFRMKWVRPDGQVVDAVRRRRARRCSYLEVQDAVDLREEKRKQSVLQSRLLPQLEGKRDRREFRLGADALPAHKKAIRLEELWLKELARHKRLLAQDQEVFPNDPKYLPVWTGMPEVEREAREAYLSPPWPSLHQPSAPSPGR